MIAALRALQRAYHPEAQEANALSTLKISGKSSGLAAFMASHPPLEKRIARLKGEA
jgi:Zn-dependent protease with chaperone function